MISERPLRILIVEDHDATNRTLSKMLTRRGYEVASAKNGEAALQTIQAHVFDLVISDIGLPDISGWDLLKQLRSHRPQLRAIALSGYGYAGELNRSTQVGFQVHLTKPADMNAIEAEIMKLFPERKPARTL